MKNVYVMVRPLLLTLYFFSAIGFCWSCGDNRRGGKAISDTSVGFNPTGLWVNKSYSDTLLLTGSPRAAQGVGNQSCLYFADTGKPSVLVVYGWHEGNTWSVYRDSGKVILYDSSEKRQIGVVTPLSPEEFRLGAQLFEKVHHPDRNNYDFDVVEELLFAGSYRTPDGTAVSFSADGKVTGWDTVSYYTPDVDYVGPGMNVDEVELGSDKSKMTTYGFKFKADTLFFYTLKCVEGFDSTDNSCGVVDFGELKWELVKKH